jgi:hypothetical protein
MKHIRIEIDEEAHARYEALPKPVTHEDIYMSGLKTKEAVHRAKLCENDLKNDPSVCVG